MLSAVDPQHVPHFLQLWIILPLSVEMRKAVHALHLSNHHHCCCFLLPTCLFKEAAGEENRGDLGEPRDPRIPLFAFAVITSSSSLPTWLFKEAAEQARGEWQLVASLGWILTW